MTDRVRFSVDTLEGTALVWLTGDSKGKATYDGGLWRATAQFVGLPARNDSFGKKRVVVKIDGTDIEVEGIYEIFYLREATNHPDGQNGSPNWFYYWLQAINAYGNVQFAGSGGTGPYGTLLGETGIGNIWNWNAAPDKTQIRIFEQASHEAIPYPQATSIRYSGIDLFANIVVHETRHLYQQTEADRLIPNSPGTCFQYGWSWNAPTIHNHWKPGPDREWGVAGKDDDFNGVIDDAKPNPLDFNSPYFEPGWQGSDDEDLTTHEPNARDWPKIWQLPSRYWPTIEAIEADAVIYAEGFTAELA